MAPDPSAKGVASNSRTASTPAGDASLPPPSSSLPSSKATLPPLINQLSDLGGAQKNGSGHRSSEDNLAAKALKGVNHDDAGGPTFGAASEDDAMSDELNVVAAYKAHFREDPVAFLQQVWAYGQGSGWRGCE